VCDVPARVHVPSSAICTRVAQDKKAQAYEALHMKSLATGGASRGDLHSQLQYDSAALDFTSTQSASINALDAVDKEIELFVQDMLCSLADTQAAMARPLARATEAAADALPLARSGVFEHRREWALERNLRSSHAQVRCFVFLLFFFVFCIFFHFL